MRWAFKFAMSCFSDSISARSMMSGGSPVISGVLSVAFHGYFTTTNSADGTVAFQR